MRAIPPLFRGVAGLAFAAILCVWADSERGVRAQPSKKVRVEEEEETPEKSKVPKKIEEIEPKGAPSTGGVGAPPKFDIAREAARATHPHVKEFLWRVAGPPYDLLLAAKGVRPYKIAPLPERHLPEGKFTYFELNDDLRNGKEKELPTGAGFSLQPWEEVVLEEVDRILDPNMAVKLTGVSRDGLEELAVQVLQVTRRWHAARVEQKGRVGKDWDAVDDKLRKRTVQLRREQLKRSVDAKNWKKADELSLELSNYSDDPEARKDIYRLLLRKALEALSPQRDEDYAALRDAVNQFEKLAGGQGEEIVRTARRLLTARAGQFVDQARKQAEANQNAAAYTLLKSAEAIDPDLPSIQELRTKLRDRVLYVGVPRLPERFSPARARSDSERWAIELLFESLLQAVPDAELGRRYRPVLATGMPGLAPLGRDFTMHRNARWSGDGGKIVDASDVHGTLEMLQKAPSLPCAEGIDLLDAERSRIDDFFHVRLAFRQGMFEPLGRTTFKILPARYLKSEGKDVEDELFARSPFGSGPYRYQGREREGPEREAVVFRANPYYSQRPGKFGLPNIREIRFVVPTLSTVGAEFAAGQLHLALDVPTAEQPRYVLDPMSIGQVTAHTLSLNRRVYMLAINHRRLPLQNADLRRGLAAAIDREKILDAVFRPDGVKTHHVALRGPFPPGCWATPVKAREAKASLDQAALAGGLFAAATVRGRVKLTLIHPDDDAQASRACAMIKDQIEAASRKTPADSPAVEISLEPVAGAQFHHKLEQAHDFDLAYAPYDYGDDLYWLGGLLDRTAAGRGGRNFLGYLAPGSNPQAEDNALRISLDEIRGHRDFRDSVREETWKVHAKFLARMPFVPLWQLDRHIVVHKNLDLILDGEKLTPEQLDAATIFTGIENWRLR